MKNRLSSSLGEQLTVKMKTVRGKSETVSGKLSRIYPNMALLEVSESPCTNLIGGRVCKQRVCISYSDLISERAQVIKWRSDS